MQDPDETQAGDIGLEQTEHPTQRHRQLGHPVHVPVQILHDVLHRPQQAVSVLMVARCHARGLMRAVLGGGHSSEREAACPPFSRLGE